MQLKEKNPENRRANPLWLSRIIGVLAVILMIGVTIYAYQMRTHLLTLQRFGYPGIFMIEFIANASVLVPIPGAAVTMAVSPLFNPIILALTASTAASLGELFGYAAGRGGNTLLDHTLWLGRIERWMEKYGGIVIAVMAAIPNPLFDTAGIAAGIFKIPAYTFFFWCWLGKTVNRLVLVFGASTLMKLMLPFFHNLNFHF